MRGRVSYTETQLTHILQSASSIRQLNQTHTLLTKTGLNQQPHLLSRLLTLSALTPWGSLSYARSLFDSTPTPSLPLYNTMIRAYAVTIFPLESLRLYNRLLRRRLPADNLTLPFVLKACGRAAVIEPHETPTLLLARKGAEIHCRSFHLGLDLDGFVQNSLIFMYSQCGRIEDARRVFDGMRDRTPVSWNTMVVAYDRHGDSQSADCLLRSMPEKTVALWNSIVTRHVRSGDIGSARRVFDEMPERDAISWNSMIAGYIRVKDYKRALRFFRQMQAEKVEPTELTIVSVLGACAETGGLEMGKEIHMYLKDKEFSIEGFVSNALMDMYAKCGSLNLARQVFDGLSMRHVSCWNSMIVASAVHGHCEESLELFDSFEKESSHGSRPNRVTFLGVLLACSHKGLVEDGRTFFRRMIDEYGIEPDIKHYGCMVDLLSRCGHLDEAYSMIKEMPIKANTVLWKTVLGACRVHGDVELGEVAFRELAGLEPLSDGDYVMMSNIYAEAERWEDVERLRCGMIGSSISKLPGCSQIELD